MVLSTVTFYIPKMSSFYYDSGMEELFYVELLKKKLQDRKNRNSGYSLRAFAQNIEVDPSLLSKIINERQVPTLETANKICKQLKLSDTTAKEFMQSVSEEKSCVELYRINPDYTDCED